MKDRKLQVFVSSTYNDLIEERQAAVEAILSAGHIPAGMELFSAGDEAQMTVIKRWIDESDVYLLILGGKYGSVDTETGKSYTQLEYEYAVETGKPLFAVVISDKTLDVRIKAGGLDSIEENIKELKSFRGFVLTKLVKFWDDKKDIKLAIHETLSEFSYRKELVGWVRGDKVVNSSLLAEEIARLTKENAELRDRLDEIKQPHYSGFTFEELKQILQIGPTGKGETKNVYEFILSNGSRLAGGTMKRISDGVFFDFCIGYRLVEHKIGTLIYSFTNDGYNFFIQALRENGLTEVN